MRILAISDTHGRLNETLGALGKLGEYDLLIHLGDGLSDMQKLRSYINADVEYTKGNNDFVDAPLSRVIEIGKTRIFCAHGHMLGVKSSLDLLLTEAKKENCTVALYGHTHIMSDTTVDGVRLINPGSVGFPYGKFGAVELLDEDEGDGIRIIILN